MRIDILLSKIGTAPLYMLGRLVKQLDKVL